MLEIKIETTRTLYSEVGAVPNTTAVAHRATIKLKIMLEGFNC